MTTTTQVASPEVPRWGWQERAACRAEDLDLFFGADGEPRRERLAREARAKAVCARCPVVAACLRHATAVPERYGVWGGLSEEERNAARRDARREQTGAHAA